jgi:hypothetical protein
MWKLRTLLICQSVWVLWLIYVLIAKPHEFSWSRSGFFVTWVTLYAGATIAIWRGNGVAWIISLSIPLVMVIYQLCAALLNGPSLSASSFARDFWQELLLLLLFAINFPVWRHQLSNRSLQKRTGKDRPAAELQR